MQFKTSDILLVSSKGFLPDAIQEFQGNKYNHAGLILEIENVFYVCEALKYGIALTNINDYLENKSKQLLILRSEIEPTNETKSKMINFCLPYCGNAPYEYINLLFYQPIKYIAKKLFGKEIWIGRSKAKSNKRFICGEWVAYVYNEFTFDFENWNKVAPVDLYNSKKFKHIKVK